MLSLHLCEGFSSALGPVGAAPGHGGKLRDGSHHPKRSPSRGTSGRELGAEKILGSEALQPLLIFRLGGTVKIDIWDALLLLEFY